ncbi:MAG: hypothetical protein V9G20_00695 [Candidatus Promineifilaceae bacterium]
MANGELHHSPFTVYHSPSLSMETCIVHPDHVAVEHCEVCHKPLCGLCLWYTEDGHRLCEVHAKEAEANGQRILEPETYAEAVGTSLIKPPVKTGENTSTDEAGVYRGNQTDVGALITAVLSLTMIASCMGGIYCLPVIAFILGMLFFLNAPQSINPQRTRVFAGISLGISGFIFLSIFCLVAFYIFIFAFAISSSP